MDPYARIAELEVQNVELRVVNAGLVERVKVLEEQLVVVLGKVAELEKLALLTFPWVSFGLGGVGSSRLGRACTAR